MKKTVLISSLLVFTFASYAGLYRWVVDTGKVHYSDKMPAAVSKKAHAELSGNGTIKKNRDPEAEKLLARQKQHEKELIESESKKDKERRLKQEKKVKKEQNHDKFLLTTYEDRDEITNFFNNKIKLLEGNSNILKAQSRVLVKKVKKLEVNKSRTSNEKITDRINKKIVRIESNIEQYKKALKENSMELIALNKSYQNDYERYTQLTQ